MNLTDDWLKTALTITGSFETNGDPWSEVTGNFDTEGVSCGVLQWNIGQGSLQPLVKAAGKQTVLQYMPNYGSQFWQACNLPIPQALATVNAWQDGNTLKRDALAELRACMGSAPLKTQQIKAATAVGNAALNLANAWSQSVRNIDTPLLHEFCWFFDLVTQNGGLKGLSHADVTDFINAHTDGQTAVQFICDWLAAAPAEAHGSEDAQSNAANWPDSVDDTTRELFILSYLRCQKASSAWEYDVMNRKGTLAVKSGVVHGKPLDFNAQFQQA